MSAREIKEAIVECSPDTLKDCDFDMSKFIRPDIPNLFPWDKNTLTSRPFNFSENNDSNDRFSNDIRLR